MRWFDGTIPAAIAAAKQQGYIFVVVITGDDEQSTQMISSWRDDRVAEASKSSCVAIKVDAKSETCVQFSQIYPVVCIPSSFFIGENGIPLEVIAGSVPAEELMKRLDKVRQMHAQQKRGVEGSPSEAEMGLPVEPTPPAEEASALDAAPVQALPPAEEAPALDVDPPQTPADPQDIHPPQDTHPPQTPATEPAASPAASKESLSRTAEEGGSTSGHVTPGEDRSSSSDDLTVSSQTDEGLDAKVDRLTKKLEERREQKKKVEEEGEIQKEMERRKQGKDMLDFKKKQEDEKTKRLLDERNREKAEEKAARERVKQQIALDRADRAARYSQNQEEVEAARVAALQARQAEQEARREAVVRERSTIARIQFRLPDGSSFTNQFPSESRLQEARQFVVQEVGNRYGNFSLATMFPRREFTGQDLEKTLLELELAPSASIVLLPQTGRSAHSVVQSSEGGLWALLGSLLYPLLAVWRFLSGFLFSSPPPAPAQRPSSAPASGPASASSSGEPKRESLRKRTLEKRPEDFKKDGKIYRLRTQEDSEDDNNTWNGNSTQQM